jgi:hypothetical protein
LLQHSALGVLTQWHFLSVVDALGQGGPNIDRVAHTDQEEAKVLPPYKWTWRVVARLGRALTGTAQGPSPCQKESVSEKALSLGEGEKVCTRRLLPRAGRKEQSSDHRVTPLSHQRSVRGMHPLRQKTRVPPREQHGEHASETHCSGQAEDIITCARRGKD